jgi:hypothetical protein
MRDFGPRSTRKLPEVTGRPSIELELRAAAQAGGISAREVPRGTFWSSPDVAHRS